MSYGLLIMDETGRVLVDNSTFTMRLITTVDAPAGTYRGVVRMACPQAKAGMMAVAVFLDDYYEPGDGLGNLFENLNSGPYRSNRNLWFTPRAPALRVGNGYIEMFSPSGGGLYHGGCIIYLYTYV